MEGKSYGQLLMEGFVKAIPWAIVLSVSALITLKLSIGMIGPEVKKATEYVTQTAINRSMNTLLNDAVYPRIKQNTKEAIEYTLKMVDGKQAKLRK